MPHVLALDIETVLDLRGYAAANGLEGKSDDEIRDAMGDRFPKHIYLSIACIGALIAHHDGDHWVVDDDAAARDVQRFVVRSARTTIPRNDTRHRSARVVRETLLQSVHRRCNRPV